MHHPVGRAGSRSSSSSRTSPTRPSRCATSSSTRGSSTGKVGAGNVRVDYGECVHQRRDRPRVAQARASPTAGEELHANRRRRSHQDRRPPHQRRRPRHRREPEGVRRQSAGGAVRLGGRRRGDADALWLHGGRDGRRLGVPAFVVERCAKPTAASIQGTCARHRGMGACRIDPAFVVPDMDGRIRPR